MRFPRGLGMLAAALVAGCGLVDGFAGGPRDDRDDGTPDAGVAAPDAGSPPDAGTDTAWSWSVPERIETGEVVESDAPSLAIRPGGRAYVAFHTFDAFATEARVYLATRAPGDSTFGPVTAVPAVGGIPIAWKPQVAAGAKGAAVVAFSGTDGATPGRSHLYAARFGDDLVVGASDVLRLDPADSDHPELSAGGSLAVDEAGRAVVAWAETNLVRVTASEDGGEWSAPLSLGQPAANGWDAVSVAASLGQAVVAFGAVYGLAGHAGTIADGFFDPGATIDLELSSSGDFVPRAAGSVDALVAWRNGARVGWARHGTRWSTPSYFDAPRIAAGSFDLAVSAIGHAVATWRAAPEAGGTSAESEQWAALFDGEAWGTPQRISIAGPHRKCWWGRVALDDLGNAVAVWADFDEGGTYTRIWAAVHEADAAGDSWSAPVPIDAATEEAGMAGMPESDRKISVAMDPGGGGATAVWIQREVGGAPRVWVARLR